jgi:hypothetical protein
MNIEVSTGEIVDKLSILQIKKNNITDNEKLINIDKEYDYLYKIVFEDLKIDKEDFYKLILINEKLWQIEDDLRIKESQKEFDEEFIELARNVYYTNDERANIKKQVNIKYGSDFVEEKSYNKY